MNINFYRWFSWVCGVLAVTFLLLLACSQMQLNRTRNDIRFARELIESFDSYRDLALRGDVSQATLYLQKLEVPPESKPFQNIAADLVERERKRTVNEIISYLRTKTGKDFGDEPERWIQGLKGFGS